MNSDDENVKAPTHQEGVNEEHKERLLDTAYDLTTPRDILANLAADPDVWVRFEVALNPQTPPDALLRLAEDPDLKVREQVTSNPHTPLEALILLAEDRSAYVRSSVAGRTGVPAQTLVSLAKDSDLRICARAWGTIPTPHPRHWPNWLRTLNRVSAWLSLTI